MGALSEELGWASPLERSHPARRCSRVRLLMGFEIEVKRGNKCEKSIQLVIKQAINDLINYPIQHTV